MGKLSLIFKDYLFLLVILLLAFIPLYPKLPLSSVTGTFVAVRLEDILIALTAIIWGVGLVRKGLLKQTLKDPLIQALLVFWGIGLFSTLTGIFLTHSVVSKSIGLLHFLRRVEFMILLPIAITAFNNQKQIKDALFLLLGVTFLVNIYALGQQYLNWPVISTTNSEFSKGLILYLTPGARVNSTFAGHYDLAVYLAMCLTLISALFFILKKRYQPLLLGLSGLSFYVLVLTAARLSFVAALVGIVMSLLLTGKKMFVLGVVILAALALIYPSQLRDRFVSTITVNVLSQGDRYTTKNEQQSQRSKLNIPTLSTTASKSATAFKSASESGGVASDITPGEPTDTTDLGVFRSFEIRVQQEWPRALRSFYKNPVLGTGYSSLGLAVDNDILRSLGETGVLGTLSFILVFWVIIKRLIQNFSTQSRLLRYLSAGLIATVVAFVLNSLFIDVFEASKAAEIFWLILGMGLSISKFK